MAYNALGLECLGLLLGFYIINSVVSKVEVFQNIGKMLEAEAWQGMMEYVLKTFVRFSLVFTHIDAHTHSPCLEFGIARTPIMQV